MSRIVLNNFGNSFAPYAGLSNSQIQLDAVFSSFSSQATDTFSIASMTAAGLAGRLARVGILSAFPLGRHIGLPLQFISHLGSVGVEAATFSVIPRLDRGIQNDRLDSPIQSGNDFTQDFITHFVNFATFRLLGTAFQSHNPLLQHLVQSAAMMAGHQIVGTIRESPLHESLAQQFFNASLNTLQIGVGNFLAHKISGHRIQSLERNLEANCRGDSRIAPTQNSPHASQLTPLLPRLSMVRPAEPDALLLSRLAPELRVVIRNALETSLRAEYRPRLVDAYQHCPGIRIDSLTRISLCLKFIFQTNAAHNSSGSFKNALLQELIEQALQVENPQSRHEILARVFRAMEQGLPSPSLLALLNQYTSPQFYCAIHTRSLSPEAQRYEKEIPLEGPLSWKKFYPDHRTLLLNYIAHVTRGDETRARRLIQIYGGALHSERYPEELIRDVLNHAIRSPLGEYILRRFTYIVAIEDVAAKLYELRETESIQIAESIPTQKLVERMEAIHMSPENMALQLNGSIHTAYLYDMRIAQRVLSFYQRLNRQNLPQTRKESLRRIAHTFATHLLPRWRAGQNLQAEDLVDLLRANPSGQMEEFIEGYENGDFEIKITTGEDFDKRVSASGIAHDCTYSYFIHRPAPEKPLILIRGFEMGNLKDHETASYAFNEVLFRLHHVIHEWEHSRHFSGPNAYNFSLDRANRLGSEILAFLEESLWKNLHRDDEIQQNLHFLGDPLVIHLRSLGDATYYAKINERLARELIP